MAFNVIETVTETNNQPVNNGKQTERVYRCKDFTGEISSVTGIFHKELYIAKINEFSGNIERPTIRLVCAEECKDGCKLLKG